MYDVYLVKGLNALKSQHLHLPNTFATVTSVKDEGLFINVIIDLYVIGQTELENIPVLKNPYHNLPIREGDRVLLISCNHLLKDYWETGRVLFDTPQDTYLAIPVVLTQNYFYNNFWTFENPEKTYLETIDEAEHIIEAPEVTQQVHLKWSEQVYEEYLKITANNSIEVNTKEYTLNAEDSVTVNTTNTTIESSDSITTTTDVYQLEGRTEIQETSPSISIRADSELVANAPSIDLGSDAVKLGSLLDELCQALASSQCIVTKGDSAGSYASLTKASDITAIGARIKSVFK